MNHLKSCIYPIFFSGFGFIIYKSHLYNQDILNKQGDILNKQKEILNKKTLDKFNNADYNPFRPQKPT